MSGWVNYLGKLLWVDIMKNKYLTFTRVLAQLYSGKFGNVWWYSLIHEKNVLKTRTPHIIMKRLQAEHFSLLTVFTQAVKKYFSFAARYCLFKFKKVTLIWSNDFRREVTNLTVLKWLLIDYYSSHLGPLLDLGDSIRVVIPQKSNWKDIWKDKSVIALDEFLTVSEFFSVFWKSQKILLMFFLHYFLLKRDIKNLGIVIFDRDDLWEVCKEDVFRSFMGDILIEGLFFEGMFRRLYEFGKPIQMSKVIYPYEGQAWEKALCKVFSNYKIAVMPYIPSVNTMMCFYDRKEREMMPNFDKLGVIGSYTYNMYAGDLNRDKKRFHQLFILGSTRHNYIKDLIGSKSTKEFNLVVLSYNDDDNEKLLAYVERKYDDYRVKGHPFSNYVPSTVFTDLFIYKDIKECLLMAKRVICSADTMVSIEALVLNVPVEVVEFDDSIDTNPLPKLYRGFTGFKNPIKDFFTFRSDEEIRNIIREV